MAPCQDRLLEGVSRTFALTIPRLPPGLRDAVANAYLLCRIADTIEDDPALGAGEKQAFSRRFIDVVRGHEAPARFARDLAPRLSRPSAAERDLIENTERVLEVTYALSSRERAALERCLEVMSAGMARFQLRASRDGLANLRELGEYCYCVAGVVGEMLTELFCGHAADIAQHRARLMSLAPSFGQGLQMTNIVKDLWEDRRRGACWLPRDVFGAHGFDLSRLSRSDHGPRFQQALGTMIAVAHGHLRDALGYALLIPRRHAGIRRFCFWAIGMAVLTLRNIHRKRDFTAGEEVKISRRAVRATIAVCELALASDAAARLAFRGASAGLPSLRDEAAMLAAGG